MLQEAPSGYEKQRLDHSRGMSYLVIFQMASERCFSKHFIAYTFEILTNQSMTHRPPLLVPS